MNSYEICYGSVLPSKQIYYKHSTNLILKEIHVVSSCKFTEIALLLNNYAVMTDLYLHLWYKINVSNSQSRL